MPKPLKSVRLSTLPAKSVPASNKIGVQQTIDGLPVKNLTKAVKLNISAADCTRGKAQMPNSCAAALAALRLPKCVEARVHLNRIYLRIGKVWWRGKVPNALRTEIAAFDKGGKFSPGNFIINPLSPSERPAGERQGGADKVNHGKRGKVARAAPHKLLGVRGSAREEYYSHK